MKTKLYIYLCLLVTFVASGCFKDQGNYNYTSEEIITIEGVNDEETPYTVNVNDNLVITPTVSSSIPGGEFVYRWEIYELNVQGYAPELTLMSEEKDLNYKVTQEAKTWTIVFNVTNKKTGYTKVITRTLNVVTPYTRGWFVIKDDGSRSDVDVFQTLKSVTELESPIEDVLFLNNGRNLEGKAGKLGMGTSYKVLNPLSGRYSNTRTLVMSTKEDVFLAPVTSMKIARDVNSFVYSPLKEKNIQVFNICGSVDQFFLNNGQLHGIYNMGSNTGVFGAPKLMDEKGTPYSMSKFALFGSFNNVLYDEISGSFVNADSYSLYLIPGAKDDESQLPISGLNLECLYLSSQDISNTKDNYGVFRDKTTGEKGIYYLYANYRSKMKFNKIADIEPGDKAFDAEIFTLSMDEKFLYFEVDGEIWSHNLVNGARNLEFTLPAGEKLSVLRHLVNIGGNYGDYPEYVFSYIVVGTNVGGNYKFRMFSKNAGSFYPKTPEIEFGGKGNCGDIIYISPRRAKYAIPLF